MSTDPLQVNLVIADLAASGASGGELLAMLPEDTLQTTINVLWGEIRRRGSVESMDSYHLGSVIRVLRAELDGRV